MNGTRNPSLSIVKKLAQGLGMQLKLGICSDVQQKIKCKEYEKIGTVRNSYYIIGTYISNYEYLTGVSSLLSAET